VNSRYISVALSLLCELAGRYLVALGIGILFLMFNGIVMSKFMSHLGMAGKSMPYDIGIFMFIEVPIWMLCVKVIGFWHRNVWIEIITAGLIAIIFAQVRTFSYYFWPNFISPTVDPYIKQQMLFWFIFTVVNYLLAIHTAALYSWMAWLVRKRRKPAYEDSF